MQHSAVTQQPSRTPLSAVGIFSIRCPESSLASRQAWHCFKILEKEHQQIKVKKIQEYIYR